MTDKQHDDEIVSATYRELASERAPENLDASVLQEAARSAPRPPYARSISWTRPLAWAATIALCLAITLEVTQGPTPADISEPASSEALLDERADNAPASDRLQVESPPLEQVRRKSSQSLLESTESNMEPNAEPNKDALGRTAAKQVADAPKRANSGLAKEGIIEAEGGVVGESAPAATFEVKAEDADIEYRAEEMERTRDRQNNPADAEKLPAAALYAITPPSECPDEVRAEPETWLECIEALEEAGNKDGASREREILIDTFPDFRLP